MAVEQSQSSSRDTDPSAWVDDHGDAMFRFAVLRVRDPELAEELVQESFVAALAARKDFAADSSLRTWLIAILRRKLADHFRRAARERTRRDDPVEPLGEDGPFDQRGIWKTNPLRWPIGDPGRPLEKREFWAVFHDCMSKLPATWADTFRLREIESLSGQEVCLALGISATNLWARLYRARMSLRRCLEDNWFGPEKKDA